jgi:hypothetical protein
VLAIEEDGSAIARGDEAVAVTGCTAGGRGEATGAGRSTATGEGAGRLARDWTACGRASGAGRGWLGPDSWRRGRLVSARSAGADRTGVEAATGGGAEATGVEAAATGVEAAATDTGAAAIGAGVVGTGAGAAAIRAGAVGTDAGAARTGSTPGGWVGGKATRLSVTPKQAPAPAYPSRASNLRRPAPSGSPSAAGSRRGGRSDLKASQPSASEASVPPASRPIDVQPPDDGAGAGAGFPSRSTSAAPGAIATGEAP